MALSVLLRGDTSRPAWGRGPREFPRRRTPPDDRRATGSGGTRGFSELCRAPPRRDEQLAGRRETRRRFGPPRDSNNAKRYGCRLPDRGIARCAGSAIAHSGIDPAVHSVRCGTRDHGERDCDRGSRASATVSAPTTRLFVEKQEPHRGPGRTHPVRAEEFKQTRNDVTSAKKTGFVRFETGFVAHSPVELKVDGNHKYATLAR